MGVVVVEIPRKTAFGVEEIIFFMYIKRLVVIVAAVFVEFVVDTCRVIVHMAVLHISKDSPLVSDVISCFDEDVSVEFVGI